MCAFFEKTKQAYYKKLKAVEQNALNEDVVLGLVKKKKRNMEAWQRQKFASIAEKRLWPTPDKDGKRQVL